MNRRLTRITLAAAAALTVVLPPSMASADTARIGSALTHPAATPELCTTCIGVQSAATPALSPNPFAAPSDGVLTSWSVRSNDMGALYSLRILRKVGTSSYLSAGRSAAPAAVPDNTDTIRNYPTSLSIKRGDLIGVELGGTATGLPSWADNVNGDVVSYATTFADGNAAPFTDIPGHELLLQATIRFCKVPNVVGQPKAAATAAVSAADCTSTATQQKLQLKAIKKTFSKKKKRKIKAKNKALKAQNGLVLSQGTAPGTTAAPPGPAVALKVGEVVKPKKKKKKRK